MSAVISLVQNQRWMDTFHKVLWSGLHLFRLLSCCHLPPLGSSWGLVGNNLCSDHGSKVRPPPQGFPLERSFPFNRRGIPGGSCWGEQLLPLLVVHFVPLNEQEAGSVSLGLCPSQYESTLSKGSIQQCSLHIAVVNQEHSADPDIVLQRRKSSLFFRECDKNGLWLNLHTWGWISDSCKPSYFSVTQIMSEVQLSGNGCTACLGRHKHRRKGEKEGFFSHCADSLLGCSCCIWRAGWKVTGCWQVRCVLKWAGHAQLSLMAGDESPTCWQWWQRGSGASQHCCCCWSAQQGPCAALCTLPLCNSMQWPWLCPKSWAPTDPCAFPGQGASDVSMEHPARMPLPGPTCGLSHSTYLCFSGNYFTLIHVLSHTQTVTAHHSRSQRMNILQI